MEPNTSTNHLFRNQLNSNQETTGNQPESNQKPTRIQLKTNQNPTGNQPESNPETY